MLIKLVVTRCPSNLNEGKTCPGEQSLLLSYTHTHTSLDPNYLWIVLVFLSMTTDTIIRYVCHVRMKGGRESR